MRNYLRMVTTNKKHLSEVHKARAVAWWEEGVPQIEIARRLNVHKRTILRLVSAYQNNGSLPARKSGSGRPFKVTAKMLAKIKEDILTDPFLTARQIKSKNRKLLENISLRTIRRMLLENLCLHSRVAAKKPSLTTQMKHRRVVFAKKYQHWTSKQWGSVLFSDESLFKTSQTTGRLVRRGQDSDRYLEKYTSKSTRFCPSLMVWGSFCSNGKGSLQTLPRNQTMDSQKYLKMLKSQLLKTMKVNDCSFFQQDNASIHTAKKIRSFLNDNNVNVIKWPGNSADLNPIENIWGLMKNKLEKKDIRTLPGLRMEIDKMWRSLKKSYLKTLAESMPKRLKLIIKKKGSMLKY